MSVRAAEMVGIDESYSTGSLGGGQGTWPPSRWSTLFFILALAWLIFVLSAEGS